MQSFHVRLAVLVGFGVTLTGYAAQTGDRPWPVGVQQVSEKSPPLPPEEGETAQVAVTVMNRGERGSPAALVSVVDGRVRQCFESWRTATRPTPSLASRKSMSEPMSWMVRSCSMHWRSSNPITRRGSTI